MSEDRHQDTDTDGDSHRTREPDAPPDAEYQRLLQRLGLAPTQIVDERYRVERMLGRGGMGEVYLAHDQRLPRQVAVKLVRANSTDAADKLQQRLHREALALARVEHPNVVGIYDVGRHGQQAYFAMQFVPGVTLREWQAQHRKRGELIDAYLQAARGLAAAHAVGVVHRDFKPENVIVGDDGVVRVLDFGLAAALQSDDAVEPMAMHESTGEHSSAGSSAAAETLEVRSSLIRTNSGFGRMTVTGAQLGTPAYMSSEQLVGRTADARSDQFSFCVAMWEALSGGRPFTDILELGLLRSIERGPKRSTLRPRWLRAILLRGLAYEARDRWPSIDALIAAIERARSFRRRLAMSFALSGLVIGAVVIDRVIDGRNDEPPTEPCSAFVDDIDAVWNDDMHAAIIDHPELDTHAADYAIARLDELARGWRATATATCVDERALAHDDPTRVCLQRWLQGFSSTVELLVQRGDEHTWASAPDLLAALAPANDDYCAAQPVDLDIATMSTRAQALAMLGDIAAAVELADATLEQAETLGPAEFSAERALAHLTRAEVAVRDGQHELALAEFAHARQHALAIQSSHLLLTIWTLEAKLRSKIDAQGNPELALALVDQAEALLPALRVAADDQRRAELLEVRARVARQRGDHRAAIELHGRAQALYTAGGHPTLAAKSLLNIGVNWQELGDVELARRNYLDAIALLDAAGLPPSYRNRVLIERNLALMTAGPAETQAEAVAHFEFVIAHGSAQERFEAQEQLLLLALALADTSLTERATEPLRAALESDTQLTSEQRFKAQRAVGFSLLARGDPSGESLLREAERTSESLTLEAQFNLQASWVELLELDERCEEARERRERLRERLAEADPQLADIHAQWRAAGPAEPCDSVD